MQATSSLTCLEPSAAPNRQGQLDVAMVIDLLSVGPSPPQTTFFTAFLEKHKLIFRQSFNPCRRLSASFCSVYADDLQIFLLCQLGEQVMMFQMHA